MPDDIDDGLIVEIDADTSAFRREIGEAERLARGFGRAVGDALTGAALKGREADDVLRSLAMRLSSLALDVAFRPLEQGVAGLLQGALGGLGGSLGGALGFAKGGAFTNGRVIPFAQGGVVAAPTYFPLGNGQTGLMGERGAEAILPLRRGPDGRLGVAAGGGGRAVNVTVNVATPDPGAFRRSDAYLSGLVARAVARGERSL
ncbi:gene transfer agent (GTA) orfg11 [Ancylobacter novellus DSM 506]|uniref:Gene transfer agent (GTA) orfg11 n=1 Tax=Ancylobacter novellus (strain ATCC 8093 / DSM 506 / JCM 20403 / CCM 1077 / IAM 12100 / NBRC 12443 / NCIMB 10456) TaxID=639283 RepID=D7A4Z7_ANCN5|nr:phage tail tape measure protein [Ancylobacter novellus]ADH88045.1 gene transfer agent (GTA) orfg11 [Ancylobacter novellus DSM 506]